MTAAYTLNVVTPHSDDAALSLGSSLLSLAQRGVHIRLLTCFSRTEWAPHSSHLDGIDAVSAWRLAEDRAFADLLGPNVSVHALGACDAPLRADWRFTAGTLEPLAQTAAAALSADLVERLTPFRTPDAAWALPMAFMHRDHALALMAGIRVAADAPVLVYEDFPYSVQLSPTVAAERRARCVNLLDQPLQRYRLAAPTADNSWERGLACYGSQFDGNEREALGALRYTHGGEWGWAAAAGTAWWSAAREESL